MIVEWETAAEDNTAGFFLYRQHVDGSLTRVNDQIVPALLGTGFGGTYRLRDRGAQPDKTSLYVLEEIEMGGQSYRHGPFAVTAGRATAAVADGPSDNGMPYVRIPHPPALAPRPAAGPGRSEVSGVLSATQVSPETAWIYTWLPLIVHNFTWDTPTPEGPPTTTVVAKLIVRTTGLYSLTAADIASVLGLSVGNVTKLIQTNKLALTNQGQMVPYLAADNNAGIYFYGQEIASPYTADNVYWLTATRGQPMTGRHSAMPTAVPLTTFRATSHAEQNIHPAPGLCRDPLADYWMWDYVVAGDAALGRKSFNIQADGAARTGPASLT
ncbi:MAG: hypothetical protein N2439_06140, partial [Anaerolineae bacterium]|nr:hypothetical protein [Anaerolineae bacterium]